MTLTAKTPVLTRVSPCGICEEQSGTGTEFSLVFPCQHHYTEAAYSYIWGMNSRPLVAAVFKTWPHHIDMNMNKYKLIGLKFCARSLISNIESDRSILHTLFCVWRGDVTWWSTVTARLLSGMYLIPEVKTSWMWSNCTPAVLPYSELPKNISSSLARQPYVGPGLPQKLLPAEVSGYCFFRFRDKSLFQGGGVSPRPTPGYPGGPMFSVRVVSLSWLVPILKRQDLAFCPCMT
jgi:hypothetical protein